MTLEWIIQKLKINGKGTKQEVLHALENATDKELYELERSITSEFVRRTLEKKGVNYGTKRKTRSVI